MERNAFHLMCLFMAEQQRSHNSRNRGTREPMDGEMWWTRRCTVPAWLLHDVCSCLPDYCKTSVSDRPPRYLEVASPRSPPIATAMWAPRDVLQLPHVIKQLASRQNDWHTNSYGISSLHQMDSIPLGSLIKPFERRMRRKARTYCVWTACRPVTTRDNG
jgi:hypothetical protein